MENDNKTNILPFTGNTGGLIQIKRRASGCSHFLHSVQVCEETRIVSCSNCGEALDPVAVLLEFARRQRNLDLGGEKRREEIAELKARRDEKKLPGAFRLLKNLRLAQGKDKKADYVVSYLLEGKEKTIGICLLDGQEFTGTRMFMQALRMLLAEGLRVSPSEIVITSYCMTYLG